jgi:hypothetical protein
MRAAPHSRPRHAGGLAQFYADADPHGLWRSNPPAGQAPIPLRSDGFTIDDVPARLDERGHLFRDVLDHHPQKLPPLN